MYSHKTLLLKNATIQYVIFLNAKCAFQVRILTPYQKRALLLLGNWNQVLITNSISGLKMIISSLVATFLRNFQAFTFAIGLNQVLQFITSWRLQSGCNQSLLVFTLQYILAI